MKKDHPIVQKDISGGGMESKNTATPPVETKAISPGQSYKEELRKWTGLFAETPEDIQKSASGLISKAAYIHALCIDLEEIINVTGAIKVHPEHPELHKQVPAVKEYARLTETYSNIINKLNNLRTRNIVDDDDDGLDQFE